ncbi:uncharacterized protein EAE97_008270 [Botrytis byssoidea]|uniref:Uncharacterized protein n=1 Tax=Botrytis byssoidea TaxID=139641 RepID=A0A9P5IIS6_9HELO|nr:uncharacterized protein EAE97_008270 [Botrytis byssoidea]KAF7935363.1 hypothetical protein EAE97_008270 [Botrytis byssoidea]
MSYPSFMAFILGNLFAITTVLVKHKTRPGKSFFQERGTVPARSQANTVEIALHGATYSAMYHPLGMGS